MKAFVTFIIKTNVYFIFGNDFVKNVAGNQKIQLQI